MFFLNRVSELNVESASYGEEESLRFYLLDRSVCVAQPDKIKCGSSD